MVVTQASSLHVLSGVAQGSVLGLLLFITYINQVTDVISQASKLNMFADDMALYRVITSSNDYVDLQNDITELSLKFVEHQNSILASVTLCLFLKKTSRSMNSTFKWLCTAAGF